MKFGYVMNEGKPLHVLHGSTVVMYNPLVGRREIPVNFVEAATWPEAVRKIGMNEGREMIADIVQEIRERTDLIGDDMVDNFHIEYGEYGGWDGLELLKAYADRFEAAWKWERDLLVYSFDPTKAERSRLPDPSAYALEALRKREVVVSKMETTTPGTRRRCAKSTSGRRKILGTTAATGSCTTSCATCSRTPSPSRRGTATWGRRRSRTTGLSGSVAKGSTSGRTEVGVAGDKCPFLRCRNCRFNWAQMPYEAEASSSAKAAEDKGGAK